MGNHRVFVTGSAEGLGYVMAQALLARDKKLLFMHVPENAYQS